LLSHHARRGFARFTVSIVRYESEKTEIVRLRGEQSKTRQDEVFGGLSATERDLYERRRERIRELESRLSERDSVMDTLRRA
jgi:hypothetical protein